MVFAAERRWFAAVVESGFANVGSAGMGGRGATFTAKSLTSLPLAVRASVSSLSWYKRRRVAQVELVAMNTSRPLRRSAR